MIPTPNLAYLAILPAVDNLATPHGEFSAIRLHPLFRNPRKVTASFCQGLCFHKYCLSRKMLAKWLPFG